MGVIEEAFEEEGGGDGGGDGDGYWRDCEGRKKEYALSSLASPAPQLRSDRREPPRASLTGPSFMALKSPLLQADAYEKKSRDRIAALKRMRRIWRAQLAVGVLKVEVGDAEGDCWGSVE